MLPLIGDGAIKPRGSAGGVLPGAELVGGTHLPIGSQGSYTVRHRLPLFVKKHNDEGTEFYYMGDVSPISDKFVQTTMGENVSVVKMKFSMNQPVADEIYDYITDKKDI